MSKSTEMKFLITGATGNVGSLVTERLLARGIRPRIFVRDADKARKRYGDRVDIAAGDLAVASSLAAALAGVDTLYLVNIGSEIASLDATAAGAAKQAGTKHLVKLSSLDAMHGADAHGVGTGVWHWHGEQAIRASGVPFTFVRPTGFMDNARYWAAAIRKDGVVYSCTGDGKIPFIHSDDIADVSVAALLDDALVGATLPITGPEALTYAQMGAKIGKAIGKTVGWKPLTEEETRAQQDAWHTPPKLSEARLSIFRAIREGRLAEVTGEVQRVLGRAPISFDRWAEQNVEAFR